MQKQKLDLKIDQLYEVIPLTPFRKTPGVRFDILKGDQFDQVGGYDRVIHSGGAISPGGVDGVERPWYMHPHQDDNLLVLHGVRYIDIYTPKHGKVEHFVVDPNLVKRNGKVLYEGPAMLVWPRGVFHRIKSDEELGSASLNFAVRYEGYDIDTEFNIYDVDVQAGSYRLIREGHEDQFR